VTPAEVTPAAPAVPAVDRPDWGLIPPEPLPPYAWGARAIYTRAERGWAVDLVWDRSGTSGEATPAERKALGLWIDKRALPVLRAMAEAYEVHQPGDAEETVISGGGYTLRANPRASYGYLYIVAYPDPAATGPAPGLRALRSERAARRRAQDAAWKADNAAWRARGAP